MQSLGNCRNLNRMGQKAMSRRDRGIQRCSQGAESLYLLTFSKFLSMLIYLHGRSSLKCCLLAGTGGGGLELVEISGPIVKVRITGPAASVMTVRVAVTQKLREKFPAIAAVQLVN